MDVSHGGDSDDARLAPGVQVIGILGGVASGKSLVTQLLAERGAAVLDADRAGHEVLREAEVRKQIRQRFGAEVMDEQGHVDRAALAAVVFAPPPRGPAELKDLEQITHPRITQRLSAQARQHAQAGAKVLVLDAAVMLKANWHRFCDVILFIDTPEELRRQRALERGWTAEEFERREASQESIPEKKGHAQIVIDNSAAPEELARQLDDLWNRGAFHST